MMVGKKQTWGLSSLLLALSVSDKTSAQEPSSVFTSASNSSLLWGPYRPNLYFGLRARLPKSLSTALLWSRVEDYKSFQDNTRFTCEQNGMEGYGWESYDPRTGGVQVIHDKDNGIDLETSFVKFEDGSGWGARIKGTVREDVPPVPRMSGELKTAVWFVVSQEGLGGVEVVNVEEGEERGFPGDVVLEGQSQDLGQYRLVVTEDEGSFHPQHTHPSWEEKPLDRSFVHSINVPEQALFQAKGECSSVAGDG